MTTQYPQCGHLRVDAANLAELGPRGAAALVYARTFGIPVLRLRPGRSDPGTRHGVHDATTVLPQIRRMFREDGNLGGRTGQGWLVADLDRKNSDDGPAELLKFMAGRGVSLPPVPYATTPSGGVHLWMRAGRELPSRYSSSRIIPGVDLLADGGHYVALPPSVRLVRPIRRGGDPPVDHPVPVPYTWAPGSCPCWAPMVPEWLADAIRSMPSIGPSRAGGGRGQADAPPLPPTDELLATGLTPGQRSHDMARLALRLWRKHGQDAVAEVMGTCRRVWAATSQGPDPFSWDEALACIEAKRRYAAAQDAADAAAWKSSARSGWWR